MSKDRRSQRVTKAEWLEAALEMLEHEGVEAVRVERLARKLTISKSGFYWHFKDRQDLLQQLLEYWAHEYTEIVSANELLLSLDPTTRLDRTMKMIEKYNLGKLDLVIRAWAKNDPKAEATARKVTQLRLDFVGKIFEELGFDEEEAEMRTLLFVCYHTWEKTMFDWIPERKIESLAKLRLELLTKLG